MSSLNFELLIKSPVISLIIHINKRKSITQFRIRVTSFTHCYVIKKSELVRDL